MRVALAALLSIPSLALAGGEVRILADVLLDQPETYEGGSLIGPPESRATWYSLGGIEPFGGVAMLALSTGVAGGDPLPGTDLGAVGPQNDIAGLNLTLRAPADAHSMRLAVRALAPRAEDAPSVSDDVARVLVAGDPAALDPWTLGDLQPGSSAVFFTARDHELDGTPFDPPEGTGTAWIEIIIPVQPGAQIALRIEVRDGGDSAFGDLLLLVDSLRFDPGIVEEAMPGPAPLLAAVTPDEVRAEAPTTVLLSGRTFPPDLAVEVVDSTGAVLAAIPPGDVRWRSAEQMEVDLPALPEGSAGIRLTWSGGGLRWDDVLHIETPRPWIDALIPDVGPAAGGGLLTVLGSGFYDVSGVTLGGVEVVALEVVSPSRIDLVVPPGGPGSADLVLFAAGGFGELTEAYAWSEAGPLGDDDDDDDGGGPVPVQCSAAGGLGGGLALAPVAWWFSRRRSAGRPPASG
jgi:hypothetical protein